MRVLLILFIPLFLLYGCESTSVRDTPPVSPDSRAEFLFTQGSFELAAIEYLGLSESYPEDFEKYRLHAAHAYIEADDTDKANLILDETDPPQTAGDLLFYKSILRAKIELNRRQPARVLTLLPPTIPEDTQRDLIILFHSVRVAAFELQKQYPDVIRERIRLANYLVDSDQMEQNATRLWNQLFNITPDELDKFDVSTIDNAAPWMELARISKNLMSNREQLRQALDKWIETNPRHPANPQITAQILAISDEFNTRPQHIALLLPLSGMYERYAEVIRDGFLAAWFNESEYKPTIRIYNTTVGNIMDVYQRAVDNGADFIVGPLEKEAVRILSEAVPIPVRTLALNQIDDKQALLANTSLSAYMPDLIQFGLPPEDEARLVAERAILEGYSKALIITSADDYGQRIHKAFSDKWEELGGRTLEEIHYSPQTADFITPVKELLNINNSETRINLLQQRLGRNVTATTRVRQDPDFVFMVASNLNARQIVPHLRFFRAESVPVYTISHVYTGQTNPQTDRDLEGVEFVDMPWILNPDQAYPAATSMSFPRYYAFGVDAFSLIPRIGELFLGRDYQFPGETGDISISKDGIVHRLLPWARFADGKVQQINIGNIH